MVIYIYIGITADTDSNSNVHLISKFIEEFRFLISLQGLLVYTPDIAINIPNHTNLLEELEELEHQEESNYAFAITSNLKEVQSKIINLSQWFDNVIDTGWQEISSLFNTTEANLAFATRSAKTNVVSRGKLINLGTNIEKKVILIVTATPESKGEMDVVVEIHPIVEETYLFPNLSLSVLDSDGEAVMQAYTRENNKNIQLEFSNDLDESFSLKLTLGEVSIIEDFIT